MKFIPSIILFLLLFSCSKEELPEQILGRWKFKEIKVDSTSNVLKATDDYYITFSEDHAVFHTDNNNCAVSCIAKKDGSFEHDFPTCTLVGGDSEFSRALFDAFTKKKIAYYIKWNKLTLLGNGYIILKKAKDE